MNNPSERTAILEQQIQSSQIQSREQQPKGQVNK